MYRPYKKHLLIQTIRDSILTLIGLLLVTQFAYGQPKVHVINANSQAINVVNSAIYIDSAAQYDEQSIVRVKNFENRKNETPVFQVTKGNIWMKFSIANKVDQPVHYLDLQYSNITHLVLYELKNDSLVKIKEDGNGIKFDQRKKTSPNFIFEVNIKKDDVATYFLKVNSDHPLLLPIFVQDRKSLEDSENFQTIITGIYVGIIFAIFFYNLFLFVSTLDKSYLIYVFFLLFLGLAQLTVSGYTFKYLWPNSPWFNKYALTSTSSLAGIAAISFGMFFLHIERYTPKLLWFFYLLIGIYAACIGFSFAGYNYLSYQILNFAGMIGGISLLAVSWYIARKGYKPGYFYFVAWISFLLGMVVFAFRNFNILPYNGFTTYILYVGSAIEAILLSIALADKINILRKEKELSQAEALRISQENEKLVREQNIQLERKVSERTEELQSANDQLSDAFKVLKDAQIQLVEAEKMASLGQLTAGIAHEINNPINFVKSNIKPLQLDINDLFEVIDEYDKLHHAKNETIGADLVKIDQMRKAIDMEFVRAEVYNLLKGIEDGADRTAEIVRGLRNFSRLDEGQLKTVNVHEGLESTLIILRNAVPDYIKIVRDFKADGDIECFPGKLNQVFMNILNNSVQAIKSNTNKNAADQIIMATRDVNDDEIEIRIKDTGPGMSHEVKQKIFDPFFTTKDVGEGTGLGLAIVFRIIQEHQGKIEVISEEGSGAEFVITLLRTIPMKTHI
jgi:two-component system NtrC family sensor kinase